MIESIISFLDWAEHTSLASAIRQSSWLYPFIEIIHIFGIVMVAGAASLFDLQVISLKPKMAIDKNALGLLTWSKRGLILAIPSGILLFITNAVALGDDPVFHLKLMLLFLALVNAYLFHVRVYLPYYMEERGPFRRTTAITNAYISLVLWMSIIACGRLLAY